MSTPSRNGWPNEAGLVFAMTVLRTDIERALEELISNEEGMRFQGLAVVLAKEKWPDLIASERKKDLGLDAYAPALLAQDGVGRGLAGSLTATLEKIKSDIEKIKQHAPDVRVLVFATPRPVTNQMASAWANAIREAQGIELIVVSREDIITDLMLPGNASVCRSHLRIDVPVEPSVAEVVAKAQDATADVIRAWAEHPRLAGQPRIMLAATELDHQGEETGESLALTDLHAMLSEGRRIVLEAPAGRGKTTTLVQLGERLREEGALAFLIDLPIWLASGVGILGFIARTPAFLSRDLGAQVLARLQGAVECAFLLNGWNEIADAYSGDAVQALRELERGFPTAGVIVATRTHRIQPPLPGAVRVMLLALTREQRRTYLEEALGEGAAQLRTQLEADPVLDDLTRTPLILSEVTTIFRSGGHIPKTKARVLGRVMQMIEQAEEHRDHLERPPISGHAQDYLAVLAVDTMSEGGVSVGETRARALVHSETQRLNAEGQIAGSPEPAAILSTLCAHHVLERVQYPSVTFRFQHQQLQEFYAITMLQRELWSLAPHGERSEHFIREYVNRPLWEEPLRMLAEEVGELSHTSSAAGDAIAAGRRLIESALSVDPVFAAELSRLCGPRVWAEVRTAVVGRLRGWYVNSEEDHRRCAVAGMLASGSEEFGDVLLPLLTSDDQQLRLRTYRAWHDFHLSSLGTEWRNVVEGWREDQRADFVGEVGLRRGMVDVAEHFALADPSVRVRITALRALQWVGANDVLSRVLTRFDDDAFDQVLREHVLHSVPDDLRPRTLEAHRRLIATADDPIERIRLRLAATEIAETDVADDLKRDLEGWPAGRGGSEREPLLRSALDIVRRTDPEWVSHWVAGRIVDGSLWPDRWGALIVSIRETLRTELFAEIGTKDLQNVDDRKIIAVLAAVADTDLASRSLSALHGLRIESRGAGNEERQRRAATARQLEDLIRSFPPNLAVAGVLNALSTPLTAAEYEIVTELFGRTNSEDPDLREHLQEELRQRLRRLLKDGLHIVLGQDDFSGELKANTALALARVGSAEDMPDLERLIRADIERVQSGMAARIRGDRGEAANGATMRWSNWYVRAVVWLDRGRAEDVLLNLLAEHDYEADAASALIGLARTRTVDRGFGREVRDYGEVWKLRGGERPTGFDEHRRRRYTQALKERIDVVMEGRSRSDQPHSFNGRLKSLANRLALLDGRESAQLILEVLALPGEWDEWSRVDGVEALLRSGAQLDAEATLRVLNPAIEHIRPRTFHDQQARYLLERCLSLLPFLEPCAAGIARISEVLAQTRLAPYELREAVRALGWSRCREALGLLREFASAAGGGFQSFAAEWINAISALNAVESKEVLLSFVDPDLPQTGLEPHLEYYHRQRIAAGIVDVARSDAGVKGRLYSLCKRELPPGMRLLLAEVIANLGTGEALIAGLDLVRDQVGPPIPYELLRGIENLFLDRRPYEGATNVYTLEPRAASEIRGRLFAMLLNDATRRRSAWALLGQIESWRLEYGRPGNEPRHPALDSDTPWPPIEIAGA